LGKVLIDGVINVNHWNGPAKGQMAESDGLVDIDRGKS